jgi:hypothetical protein
MRNKFLKIKLNDRNEFRTSMNVVIPSITTDELSDVDVKIDTGCPYTSIPVKKLGVSDERAQELKQKDSNDKSIRKELSFGVNDSLEKKKRDKELFKEKNYTELTSVTFRHTDVKIKLSDIDIRTKSVKLSYDRTGNILIGMDILKDWDIHIGRTDTGDTIFLACPNEQLNDEYFRELNHLFGTGDRIITAET